MQYLVTFLEGIIINGVSVAGMTKDQALATLRPNQPAEPTLDISPDDAVPRALGAYFCFDFMMSLVI